MSDKNSTNSDNNSSESPPKLGNPPAIRKNLVKPSEEGELETSLEVMYENLSTRFNGTVNSHVHFMNACRLQSSVFTCAVDSFLEICSIVLWRFLQESERKSHFFEILNDTFLQYNNIFHSDSLTFSDSEHLVARIRQPVWDFLVSKCPSFVNRDAEAQFSEIFSSCIFNELTEEEKSLFQTQYTLAGVCENCREPVSTQSKIMLNYVSELDLNSLENIHEWSSLLDPLVRNKSLLCRCNHSCNEISLDSFVAPKIFLLEFFKEASNLLRFDECIIIQGQQYILKGLVKHGGRHFACVVSNGQSWYYLDDLNDSVIIYDCINDLFRTMMDDFSLFMSKKIMKMRPKKEM